MHGLVRIASFLIDQHEQKQFLVAVKLTETVYDGGFWGAFIHQELLDDIFSHWLVLGNNSAALQ